MIHVGIDPSSKTGIVRLDEQGNIDLQIVAQGIGKTDPRRIATLVDSILSYVPKGAKVAIEGFSMGSTGQGVGFQYGLGYMIRDRLFRRGITYVDVAPTALKTFAGAKTHYGPKGKMQRFKGDEVKAEMARACYEKWGYENSSNDIIDAFALAMYSLEDIQPQPKPKKPKTKRSKRK